MRWRDGLLALSSAALLTACSGTSTTVRPESPTSIAVQNNIQMGRAYLERGQLDMSLEKLTRALELDPRSVDAHTMIAVLYERIDRASRAEQHYRRAVELAPESGAENNNLGQFLCRSRRFEEAQARFKVAMDDPFYKTPGLLYTNAGLCALDAGDLVGAEAHLRKALQFDSSNPGLLFALAKLSFEQQQPLKARAFIQRFEAQGARSPEALELAAHIEAQLGDAAASSRYIEQLRSEFPDFTPSKAFQGEPETP